MVAPSTRDAASRAVTPGASPAELGAMARAIALASLATAVARPNPGVGCVLLRDGEVVAEGSTQPVGGPHAEIVALEQAGRRARGATAVVSLEPCNHTGRTGPCSRALLDAGIRRVVYAVGDPGPQAGGGARALREGGVEVVGGVLGDWAREVHRSFLHLTTTGRPHVTLKVARTRDGAMALAGRRWVTGPEARHRVHQMRARADGVLVGIGTVLADDPRLDVRDAPAPAGQPVPVVVDTSLRTPVTARVVARGAIVLAGEHADLDRQRALEAAGATVLRTPLDEQGHVDLAEGLRQLGERGLVDLLAEPGPTLGEALCRAGLVADLVVHTAPDVADADDLPTVAPSVAHPLALDVRRVRFLGDDLEVCARFGGSARV